MAKKDRGVLKINMALRAIFQKLRGALTIGEELNSQRGMGELNSQRGLDFRGLPCFSASVLLL